MPSQNALLPAGFRQKDQTTKPATGPFDRERLLSYLEKQALEHKDREDFVPFTGEKKGMATFHVRVESWPTPGCRPFCQAGQDRKVEATLQGEAGESGAGLLEEVTRRLCPSQCLPHCPLAPASGLGVLPARPWLEASAGMAGLTLSTLLPGLVRLCAAGGVGQGKRCLPKPVLPAVTVCDNSGNMLPKNKCFSACLLAHLVTLFVQIASLFPLALQLQRKREKQENLIT